MFWEMLKTRTKLMLYTLFAISLLYGVFIGFERMHLAKLKNVEYKEPKNIVDYIING